jgi:hypothetical protein
VTRARRVDAALTKILDEPSSASGIGGISRPRDFSSATVEPPPEGLRRFQLVEARFHDGTAKTALLEASRRGWIALDLVAARGNAPRYSISYRRRTAGCVEIMNCVEIMKVPRNRERM